MELETVGPMLRKLGSFSTVINVECLVFSRYEPERTRRIRRPIKGDPHLYLDSQPILSKFGQMHQVGRRFRERAKHPTHDTGP